VSGGNTEFFLTARKIEPFFAYLFLETGKMIIKPHRVRTIELEGNLRYNKMFRTFSVRNQEEWPSPVGTEGFL
jgi:hypothetical protein